MEPGRYQIDTSGMARAHGHVEAALSAAPEYVGAATGPSRVNGVASFYENILEYVHVHHGAEDEVLYPLLEERCTDDRDMIERIGSQHRLLDEPMASARDAIARWRSVPSTPNAAEMIRALTGLLDTFSPHCRDEEELVMPLASSYLSPEEWREMLVFETQNYGLDIPWVFLGYALDRATPAVREVILAHMPESMRTQWDEEWSLAYESLMAEVRP